MRARDEWFCRIAEQELLNGEGDGREWIKYGLETTPISKVPIGGVFICKGDFIDSMDRWEVHRKTNTPIGYVFIESELIYATRGMASHGDKVCRYYFPNGDTPVVYTGIVLKGEIV